MRKTFFFLALGLLVAMSANAVEKKVYSYYNSSTKTLTFTYDDQYDSRSNVEYYTGSSDRRFSGYETEVTSIVVDQSLETLHRASWARLFYAGGSGTTEYHLSKVTSITGLQYIKTDLATDLTGMFNGLESIESIDVSTFNTSKVISTSWLFGSCKKLKTINLGDMDITALTNTTFMFGYCSELEKIYCTTNFSASTTLSTSTSMFYATSKLVGGNGTKYVSSIQDKTYARPDGGTSAPGYFTAPKKVYTVYTDGNKTLTYYCDDMYAVREGAVEFYNPSNADHFPIDYASKVEKIVVNASMADTALTYMSYLFASRTADRRLVNVTDITGLGNLNTSKTTSMSYMFAGLESLTVLDLTMLETPNLSAMDHMFYHCIALEKLDISSFNTSKVTSMRETFLDCLKLRAFNFTKADCSNVTDMTRLFAGNTGSTTKPTAMVTIWCNADLTSKTASSCGEMFLNCQNIEGGKGTKYNASKIRNEYARPDGGPESETPGYFTPTSVLQTMIDEVVESLESLITTPDATVQAIIDAEVADVQAYEWDLNNTLTFNQSGFDATFSETWFLEVKGKVADAYQLSAAKKALSGIISELQDLYDFAANYAEAKDIKFIQDQIDAAQAVVDNPAATLTQVNDAKTAASTALETDAGLILLVAQQEACKELEALLKPDDSDACKQIVANAKNVVLNTTWDKTKTVKENIDIISKTIYDNYQLTMVALEEQREKDHPTAIDQILNTQLLDGKFIRNGQLIIIRDGKIFNAAGAEMK